ncbi:MFS transporter [Chloroflexi bacterium TSY]|nr:MFS transporter [Chloroflexi bacterium TSY]
MSRSPWQVVIPVSLGTALSLVGDSSLYTVLATHTEEAGVALASVGLLLSANRWIRLPLNPVVGLWIEGRHRRRFFVPALFIGALSTAIYALNIGYIPFLLARILWGLAWVGIWVTGNTIVLDASPPENRGRWVGIYQTAFFLGTAGGAILGGLLTDGVGYRAAMAINAAITLIGALIALFFLPETRDWQKSQASSGTGTEQLEPSPVESGQTMKNLSKTTRLTNRLRLTPGHLQLLSASSVLGANRIAIYGMLTATLGLYLQQEFGTQISLPSGPVGSATLTGLGLGLTTLVSMLSAPISGSLSDRAAYHCSSLRQQHQHTHRYCRRCQSRGSAEQVAGRHVYCRRPRQRYWPTVCFLAHPVDRAQVCISPGHRHLWGGLDRLIVLGASTGFTGSDISRKITYHFST